jgi:hypothetical protein
MFFLGVSIGALCVAHVVVGVIARAAATVSEVAAGSTAIVTTTGPTTARAAGAIGGRCCGGLARAYSRLLAHPSAFLVRRLMVNTAWAFAVM